MLDRQHSNDEPPSTVVELRRPISACGRVWSALQLRRLSAVDLAGVDEWKTISRCASVPLAAVYDMAPADVSDAMKWIQATP